MKLIDLLVQELPKRGGWPEGAESVVQDADDSEFYFFTGGSVKMAVSHGGLLTAIAATIIANGFSSKERMILQTIATQQ